MSQWQQCPKCGRLVAVDRSDPSESALCPECASEVPVGSAEALGENDAAPPPAAEPAVALEAYPTELVTTEVGIVPPDQSMPDVIAPDFAPPTETAVPAAYGPPEDIAASRGEAKPGSTSASPTPPAEPAAEEEALSGQILDEASILALPAGEPISVAEPALEEPGVVGGPSPGTEITPSLEAETLQEPGVVTLMCPICGGTFGARDLRLAPSGKALEDEVAAELEELLSRVRQPGETGDFAPQLAAADFRIAVPEEEARRRPFARPPGKKVNILKELVSWVGGGLLGLIIAYYLLVLIRGDHGNFLRIPLPGIKSTYKYSPSWFPPFLRDVPSQNSSEPEETEVPPAGNKRSSRNREA